MSLPSVAAATKDYTCHRYPSAHRLGGCLNRRHRRKAVAPGICPVFHAAQPWPTRGRGTQYELNLQFTNGLETTADAAWYFPQFQGAYVGLRQLALESGLCEENECLAKFYESAFYSDAKTIGIGDVVVVVNTLDMDQLKNPLCRVDAVEFNDADDGKWWTHSRLQYKLELVNVPTSVRRKRVETAIRGYHGGYLEAGDVKLVAKGTWKWGRILSAVTLALHSSLDVSTDALKKVAIGSLQSLPKPTWSRLRDESMKKYRGKVRFRYPSTHCSNALFGCGGMERRICDTLGEPVSTGNTKTWAISTATQKRKIFGDKVKYLKRTKGVNEFKATKMELQFLKYSELLRLRFEVTCKGPAGVSKFDESETVQTTAAEEKKADESTDVSMAAYDAASDNETDDDQLINIAEEQGSE